jgi:hypothetical protein
LLHLGKGVRTVQRYERAFGLPVRRPSGNMMGPVIATKAELDGWIAASPVREAFLLTRVGGNVEGNFKLAVNELRALIAQTHRLRSETAELRKSLRWSWEMLRANLQEAMTRTGPTPQSHGSTLSAHERRALADVLPFDPTKKKIS